MRFRGGEFSTGTKGNFQSELTCSSLTVCLPLWSLLPQQFPAGQLVTFTSGQNVLRCLRTYRIC